VNFSVTVLGSLTAMPIPRRRLPSTTREIPWAQLRRHATLIFLMLRAGWTALSADERNEARRLVSKSRGRPRNLSRDEAKRLGALAGRAARAAAGSRRR
jgi:hypothetical protein